MWLFNLILDIIKDTILKKIELNYVLALVLIALLTFLWLKRERIGEFFYIFQINYKLKKRIGENFIQTLTISNLLRKKDPHLKITEHNHTIEIRNYDLIEVIELTGYNASNKTITFMRFSVDSKKCRHINDLQVEALNPTSNHRLTVQKVPFTPDYSMCFKFFVYFEEALPKNGTVKIRFTVTLPQEIEAGEHSLFSTLSYKYPVNQHNILIRGTNILSPMCEDIGNGIKYPINPTNNVDCDFKISFTERENRFLRIATLLISLTVV